MIRSIVVNIAKNNIIKKIINIIFIVIIRIFKVRILVNHMFGSTGHTFLELHYIFLIKSRLKYKKYNYYLFAYKSKFIIELQKIFSKFFFSYKEKPLFKLVVINKYFEYILNIFLLSNNDFSYDVGLGHFTNNTKESRSGIEGFNRYIDYYRLKNKNKKNFFNKPILDNESKKLRKKLGIRLQDKIVNIHLKNFAGNACAKKTDPKTYIQVIKYLQNKNYKIFFIGREKMPKIFKKYKIFDYANSNFANIGNDILITYTSSFNICFASGIFSLANYFDKPMLYLGSWHLNIQSHSKKNIFFPAVLKQKYRKKFIHYKEQIKKVVDEKTVKKGANFKKDKIEVINPTGNDILFAFKELESIEKKNYKKSLIQKKFNSKFKGHPQEYSKSIVSKKFLQKYYKKVFY